MNSDKLPQLPIPELESTLDRYLTTIQPWVSDDYLEKHRRVVDMFRNGLGQELHRRLLERAKLAESLARNEHTSSSTTFRPHYEPQPLNHQSPSQSPQQMLINSSSEQLDKQSGHRQSDSSASLIEQVPVTKSSWLIDWWNQYSYLRYREPVVINVSFFFTFPDDQRRMDRQFRAASLIYYAMDFRQQIIE
jgi:hypothetical protein